MMPGIQPRIVRQILMSKSAPHPRSKNTPRGGKMKAKMILHMSDAVKAIMWDDMEEREELRAWHMNL